MHLAILNRYLLLLNTYGLRRAQQNVNEDDSIVVSATPRDAIEPLWGVHWFADMWDLIWPSIQ